MMTMVETRDKRFEVKTTKEHGIINKFQEEAASAAETYARALRVSNDFGDELDAFNETHRKFMTLYDLYWILRSNCITPSDDETEVIGEALSYAEKTDDEAAALAIRKIVKAYTEVTQE